MRKAVIATTAAAAAAASLVLAAGPASATAVGSGGNTINTINTTVKIAKASGGSLARGTFTVACNPNDWGYIDPSYYTAPTVYVSLSETINGRSYTAYSNTRQAAVGGYWQCGSAQALTIGTLPNSGDPAWKAGKGVLQVYMYGQDSSGNWFNISKKATVTFK